MPILPLDFYPKATQALSASNVLALLGATDTIWSANATVPAVLTAIRALPVKAGTSPDLIEKVAIGIQAGVDAGVIANTHGFTTLLGASTAIQSYLPEYPVDFAGNLPQ